MDDIHHKVPMSRHLHRVQLDRPDVLERRDVVSDNGLDVVQRPIASLDEASHPTDPPRRNIFSSLKSPATHEKWDPGYKEVVWNNVNQSLETSLGQNPRASRRNTTITTKAHQPSIEKTNYNWTLGDDLEKLKISLHGNLFGGSQHPSPSKPKPKDSQRACPSNPSPTPGNPRLAQTTKKLHNPQSASRPVLASLVLPPTRTLLASAPASTSESLYPSASSSRSTAVSNPVEPASKAHIEHSGMEETNTQLTLSRPNVRRTPSPATSRSSIFSSDWDLGRASSASSRRSFSSATTPPLSPTVELRSSLWQEPVFPNHMDPLEHEGADGDSDGQKETPLSSWISCETANVDEADNIGDETKPGIDEESEEDDDGSLFGNDDTPAHLWDEDVEVEHHVAKTEPKKIVSKPVEELIAFRRMGNGPKNKSKGKMKQTKPRKEPQTKALPPPYPRPSTSIGDPSRGIKRKASNETISDAPKPKRQATQTSANRPPVVPAPPKSTIIRKKVLAPTQLIDWDNNLLRFEYFASWGTHGRSQMGEVTTLIQDLLDHIEWIKPSWLKGTLKAEHTRREPMDKLEVLQLIVEEYKAFDQEKTLVPKAKKLIARWQALAK
ncbi:hypothetical protein R3P38DRAFT_2829831 [Favolaschia claudopus]|uniref:Uncharacterized protein n=1 Tax=Favolaschia claudopus TaxID=2862362 RepID=A0AAW0EB51_9AGAR